MGKHQLLSMAPIILAFISYVATVIINALSSIGGGIFLSNQVNLSAEYNTTITPAGWTFSIWGFIYAWQALHLIYGLSLICRRGRYNYLYKESSPVPISFHLIYIVNCACNIGWIFTFDREELEASCVFLFLIAATLYACNFVAHRQLALVGGELLKEQMRKEIWLTRLLVHNGTAFYNAWVTVASLLNLTIVLKYRHNVSDETCAWLSLALLNGILLMVFLMETVIFDKYLRYTFSHYITVVVALSGILSKNYNADHPYMFYAIFLLAFSATLGLVKVIVMAVRTVRDPIIYNIPDTKDQIATSAFNLVH